MDFTAQRRSNASDSCFTRVDYSRWKVARLRYRNKKCSSIYLSRWDEKLARYQPSRRMRCRLLRRVASSHLMPCPRGIKILQY